MDSKAQAQFLIVIIIIIGFLMMAGVITLPSILRTTSGPTYITHIEYLEEITRYQNLKIILTIENPTSKAKQFNLDVSYNERDWDSYNSYLSRGDSIPIDILQPQEYTKYTIEFRGKGGYVREDQYQFSFALLEEGEILQTEDIIVNVR